MNDFCDISRRDLMSQQLPRPAQVIVHLMAHRELQGEAPRAEG